MEEKNFNVNISFVGVIQVNVKGVNKEDILDRIYDSLAEINIQSKNNDVIINNIEYNIVDNIPELSEELPLIDNIEIIEDEEEKEE